MPKGNREREKNTYSLLLLKDRSALGAGLLLALALLEQSLRDQNLVVGGNGTVFTQIST
jgi:hypothetical protein